MARFPVSCEALKRGAIFHRITTDYWGGVGLFSRDNYTRPSLEWRFTMLLLFGVRLLRGHGTQLSDSNPRIHVLLL